jgi:hypothetical protein
MDRRRHKRFKRRISCELVVGDQHHRALATDLSVSGLYLQTKAPLQGVEVVRVIFPPTKERPEIQVKARPVRKRQVPPQLAALTPPGMGLEILESPDDYVLLAEGRPFPPRFQVRVRQVGGPRSRVRTVYADDEEGAAKFVLDQLGSGWEIIEVERA